jgi:hypothetical protein
MFELNVVNQVSYFIIHVIKFLHYWLVLILLQNGFTKPYLLAFYRLQNESLFSMSYGFHSPPSSAEVKNA